MVRPAAGAIAFAASAGVVSDIHPIMALAAGLLVSGSVHVVKAGVVRPMVTAVTGGAGNVPVSIAEMPFQQLFRSWRLFFLSLLALCWSLLRLFLFGDYGKKPRVSR